MRLPAFVGAAVLAMMVCAGAGTAAASAPSAHISSAATVPGVHAVAAAVADETGAPRPGDGREGVVAPELIPLGTPPATRAPEWLAVGGIVFGVTAALGLRMYRRRLAQDSAQGSV